MPFSCGCKPGTYEDGWQEVKSPACLEIERAEWARIYELGQRGNLLKRMPKSNIGPITIFVRQNGRLVRVVTEP